MLSSSLSSYHAAICLPCLRYRVSVHTVLQHAGNGNARSESRHARRAQAECLGFGLGSVLSFRRGLSLGLDRPFSAVALWRRRVQFKRPRFLSCMGQEALISEKARHRVH